MKHTLEELVITILDEHILPIGNLESQDYIENVEGVINEIGCTPNTNCGSTGCGNTNCGSTGCGNTNCGNTSNKTLEYVEFENRSYDMNNHVELNKENKDVVLKQWWLNAFSSFDDKQINERN
jgi:hypothetical protein